MQRPLVCRIGKPRVVRPQRNDGHAGCAEHAREMHKPRIIAHDATRTMSSTEKRGDDASEMYRTVPQCLAWSLAPKTNTIQVLAHLPQLTSPRVFPLLQKLTKDIAA